MNRDVLQVNFKWKTENKGSDIRSFFKKKPLTPFSSLAFRSKGICQKEFTILQSALPISCKCTIDITHFSVHAFVLHHDRFIRLHVCVSFDWSNCDDYGFGLTAIRLKNTMGVIRRYENSH